MNYSYTLSKKQEEWLFNYYSIHRALLESIPKCGLQLRRTFQSITSHEKNWIRWKRENCPSFERDAVEPANVKLPKKTTDAIIEGNLGTRKLTHLWSFYTPDAILRSAAMDKTSFQGLIRDLDYAYKPDLTLEDGVEEDALPDALDKTYTWQIFRSARSNHLNIFTQKKDGKISSVGILEKWRLTRDFGTPKEEEIGKPEEKDDLVQENPGGVEVEEATAEELEGLTEQSVSADRIMSETQLVMEEAPREIEEMKIDEDQNAEQ